MQVALSKNDFLNRQITSPPPTTLFSLPPFHFIMVFERSSDSDTEYSSQSSQGDDGGDLLSQLIDMSQNDHETRSDQTNNGYSRASLNLAIQDLCELDESNIEKVRSFTVNVLSY